MIEKAPYEESATILAKVLGALAMVISLRWILRVFAGDDGKKGLSTYEFLKFAGFLFFVFWGSWIIYKEGERTDLSHEVYGAVYLSIVFGGLLTVLHLDAALDKITKMIEAIAKLRRGPAVQAEGQVQVNVQQPVQPMQGQQ